MTSLKLFLVVSLAFNAGLLTLFFFQASREGPAALFRGGEDPETEPAPVVAAEASDQSVPEAAPALRAQTELAARSARSVSGLRQLQEDLLGLGYSQEAAGRVLKGAVLNEWLSEMERSFRGGDEEFWRGQPYERYTERYAEMVERRRHYESLLGEAIGGEFRGFPSFMTMMHGQGLSGVPEEKAGDVLMVEEDYALLMAEIHGQGVMLPGEGEALRLLEEERQEDLAAILTPEELEEYELRNSSTSHALRYQLRTFEPTEEEFRTIFALRRDIVGGSAGLHWTHDDEDRTQREEAEAVFLDVLREELGEERFAEYERSQDHAYSTLVTLTDRLELPRARADEVHRLGELAQEQQRELQMDGDLSMEDRQEAAELLFEETRGMITEALGEDGYELYKQHGGWWLNQLEMQASRGDGDDGE